MYHALKKPGRPQNRKDGGTREMPREEKKIVRAHGKNNLASDGCGLILIDRLFFVQNRIIDPGEPETSQSKRTTIAHTTCTIFILIA